MSILLIEDNAADVGLVLTALEEYGIQGQLLVLSDGENAIQFINALDDRPDSCPDLVILDVNLPRRSGHEVLKHIRLSAKCHNVSVLVLSSSGARTDRTEAARLGATRYIQKPSRLDEFLSLGAVFKEVMDLSRL